MCVDGPTRGLNNSRFGGGPSACRDPGRKAVVVQVTDSCPCVYPGASPLPPKSSSMQASSGRG